MSFEVEVAGRDVLVRPAFRTWSPTEGDWIVLSRDEAALLARELRGTDRYTAVDNDEDG